MAAHLVARALLDETLMTETQARGGLRVRSHHLPDVFGTTTPGRRCSTTSGSSPAGWPAAGS